MKKNLIAVFLAATVLIASCSKEKAVEPELKDETLYPVTFNVSTFKTEVVPMANAANRLQKLSYQGNGLGGPSFQATGQGDDWLGNKIEYLEYYVFNESGSGVNHISQWHYLGDDTDDSMRNEKFGLIEDTLPAGNYKIVLKTGNEWLSGDNTYARANVDHNHDAFGKAFDITVVDVALEQSVELDRIVGKLEVKFLDKIPNDITTIVLSIAGISGGHYFYGGKFGSGDTFEKTIHTTSPNLEGQLFLYFGYQDHETSSGQATVNIRAYGKEGNLVINKIIKDVPVGVNKTTILSGKLLEESASSKGQGFSVSLKDNWLEKDNISF